MFVKQIRESLFMLKKYLFTFLPEIQLVSNLAEEIVKNAWKGKKGRRFREAHLKRT